MISDHYYVYFLKAKEKDIFKIGMSKNPQERLSSVQVGCPYVLSVFETVECNDEDSARHLERYFHDICRQSRTSGEWFSVSEEDIRLIIHESLHGWRLRETGYWLLATDDSDDVFSIGHWLIGS